MLLSHTPRVKVSQPVHLIISPGREVRMQKLEAQRLYWLQALRRMVTVKV